MADPYLRSESPDPTLCSNMPLAPIQNPPDTDPQEEDQDQRVPDVPDVSSAPHPPPPATQDDIALAVPSSQEPIDSEVPAPAPDMEPTPIPKTPKVSITLLLVSGRRRTVEFEPKTSIGELKEIVWSTWPSDWSDELPPSAAFLRILYLGRILTDETSLTSLNLPEPPESTVVHVSVRSFAPTSSDEDMKKKPKKRGTRRGRSTGTDAGVNGADVINGGELEDEGSRGCCGGCIIC